MLVSLCHQPTITGLLKTKEEDFGFISSRDSAEELAQPECTLHARPTKQITRLHSTFAERGDKKKIKKKKLKIK